MTQTRFRVLCVTLIHAGLATALWGHGVDPRLTELAERFDAATGVVRVTDSKASCEAAARPDVAPEYNNYCVECLTSYMEDDVEVTYVLPIDPVPARAGEGPGSRSGFGVAFNGVKLEAPAPTDAILRAHTLAPFDDCGGHVNLHDGYHYPANEPGANRILGCLRGEVGGSLADDGETCDASRRRSRPREEGPRPAPRRR